MNDYDAFKAFLTSTGPPSQNVARTVTHYATSPPNISVIEAKTYSWIAVNLSREDIHTKHMACILSSFVLKRSFMLFVIFLS